MPSVLQRGRRRRRRRSGGDAAGLSSENEPWQAGMSLGTAQQVTQAVAQAIRNRDGPRLAAALELDMGNTNLLT